MKKLKALLLNTLFIFISLLDTSPLCAVNESERVDTIFYYIQCGNYANALKIARNLHEESGHFSETVASIENCLLTLGSSMLLFDDYLNPRPQLLELLELVGMHPLNHSITQINDWAQKNLLRKGERWDQQTTRFELLKPKLMPLLTDLGFVEEVSSHFTSYQGAIIHGALLPRVRLRLDYLIKQWEQGVRFTHLYFLGGARPLEPQYETLCAEGTLSPTTECEMMQFIWEKSDVPIEMRNLVKVYFINAPMKKDPNSNKLLRPTTDDTVEYWLKTEPPYGRYLAITNAPYTNRQDLVIRILSPSEYTFDTIGPAAKSEEKMIIFLDELARLIFQIKVR